jgi:hypothetical protein
MSVTAATAITQVRALIDEPIAQFWSNAQLQSYINQGCADFARRTRTLRTTEQVVVGANTQNYNAPADIYAVYRVECQPKSTGQAFIYPLDFMGYNEADEAWGVYQTFPAAWPQMYTLWGNPPNLKIRLFPVPDQAGVLNVFGYRQSVDTIQPTDLIDVLQGYEDAIYEYAAYKAFRQDNSQNWQDAKAAYEAIVMDATNNTGWYTDQPNSITTGQSSWPPWAQTGSDYNSY